MKLFEPGKIGKLWIKNRIIMAPMGIFGLVEPDGRFSERAIEYYAVRARGGVGLITTGAVFVERKIEPHLDHGFTYFPRADSTLYIPRLNELAEAVHDYGAKLSVQLTAGFGRVSGEYWVRVAQPPAPSAVPCFWNPKVMTRELSIEEIERLVRAFRFAAAIVKAAGADAIELHGHEGYLLDQFKTSLWNRRTDKYGGDLDGRLRFPLEVISAVRRSVGDDFPIIYRYGLTHYLPGGREIEEGLEIARRLENAGVDALHVDAGCYDTWHWPHPPTYQPPGCMVNMAEAAKKVVNIPVIAVGKLGYPELAEKVLERGQADFIAIGRPLLAEPEWPDKVKDGRWDDIRMCIGGHDGCFTRILKGQYISCSLNPACGNEKALAVKPAERKRSVLVIGGGPGGMEAARVAALRGHKVTLWEKKDKLGGNLIPCSIPDFKQDIRSLISYLSTQMKKLGVDIRLGKEATPELIEKEGADVVLVATGARTLFPEITGVDKDIVLDPIDLLMGRREAGENVIVAGGGLVGSEVAAYLAEQGKKVTIIEMLKDIAYDLHPANRMHLLDMLTKGNVTVMTSTTLEEISNEGVVVTDAEGKEKTLKADTVVLALGMKEESELWNALKGKVRELHAIGDCVKPRRIMDAMWEGYRLARLI